MSKEKKISYQLPLVSVITPCYNSAKFIEETINSVLSQSYKNWEMIIVDDHSSDNSLQIIEEYAKQDSRIKLTHLEHNVGSAEARNQAIEKAKGEFIAFLDSDDIWLSRKLERQIALMQNKNVLLSYTAYYTIDESGKALSTFAVNEKVTYQDLLKTSSIGTLTTIYNVKELGKFYFEDIGHEDYRLKLQILKKIEYAQGIIEPLAKYRVHDNGLSNNKFKAAKWQWHIYRNVEKISFLRSLYYFLHYAYFGFFKYKRSS